jgi:hypothetical protein
VFFRDNPDEELTMADLMVKFSASESAIYSAVTRLAKRRELESVHVIRRPEKGRAR